MNTVIQIQISPEDFKSLLKETLREEISGIQFKPPEQKFYSRQKAAEILNISLPTLDKYTRLGRIRGTRLGGRVLYSDEDLKKALKEIPSRQAI